MGVTMNIAGVRVKVEVSASGEASRQSAAERAYLQNRVQREVELDRNLWLGTWAI